MRVYGSFFPVIVPGLIVILPHLYYTPLVRVLFIGLVSTTLVFHTTHAHVSFFVTESRTVNIRFAAYSPALPFTLDRQRSHSPTFVLSLSRPSPETYRILI